jgi:diacylglycerol kinase (ATP)
MRNFFRDRLSSFRPAIEGWRHVLRTQPNAWIHTIISIAVIAVGFWVQMDTRSWSLIAVTMAVVWITEIVNTAIEAAVDLASPDHHPLAKVAKDVSAAAVVIAAFAAVLIGILLLGPPLWSKGSELFSFIR